MEYFRSETSIVTTGPRVVDWLTLTGQDQAAARSADVQVRLDWPDNGPVVYDLQWGEKTTPPYPAIGADMRTIAIPGMIQE